MGIDDSTRRRILAEYFLKAAEEEDTAVYSMSQLSRNDEHLKLFGPQRDKVVRCLNILIKDTEKHQKLLMEVAERLIKHRD